MRKIVLLFAVLAFVGCRSTKPPSSEQWLVDALRSEAKRQAVRVGHDPRPMDEIRIGTLWCPATDRNRDGDMSCDLRCTETDGCVHAWFMGSKGGRSCTFMFTGDQKDPKAWMSVNARTLRHEVTHLILIYYDGIYGHPTYATINGKKWRVSRIANVRWPSRILEMFSMRDHWQDVRDVTFDTKGIPRGEKQLEFDLQ